jgi:2'-5' RNA ligase
VLYNFAVRFGNKEEYKTILMGYNNWLKQLANELNKQLSMGEQKQAKATYYSTLYSKI